MTQACGCVIRQKILIVKNFQKISKSINNFFDSTLGCRRVAVTISCHHFLGGTPSFGPGWPWSSRNNRIRHTIPAYNIDLPQRSVCQQYSNPTQKRYSLYFLTTLFFNNDPTSTISMMSFARLSLFCTTLLLAPPGTSSLQPGLPWTIGRARRRPRSSAIISTRGGSLAPPPILSTTSLVHGQDEIIGDPEVPAVSRDTSMSKSVVEPLMVVKQEDNKGAKQRLPWYRYLVPSANMVPELVAESFGTFLLLQLALGIVSSAVIAESMSGVFPIAVLTGGAITAAVAAVSSRCAAHFNPAITWAMCLHRKFGWTKLVPYCISQLVGAVLAAAVNYGLYAGHIRQFEATKGLARATMQGIATAKTTACFYDVTLVTPLAAFLAEVFGTFMLSSAVFSLTSEKNTQVKGLFVPPMIGAVVALIITIIGPITCASLNPARELGPRLVLKLFGWSTVAFHQLGIYLLAPMVGATLGGWFVDNFLYGDYKPVTLSSRHVQAKGDYSSQELKSSFQ